MRARVKTGASIAGWVAQHGETGVSDRKTAGLGAPALVSWAGIDLVDSDHPLVYGRAGVYGQRAANFVLSPAGGLVP